MAFDFEVGVVFGLDVIFSISSAQYGVYLYFGPHADLTVSFDHSSFISGSVSISHGWIWNLWNTDNYLGPFTNINLGVGPHGGMSLFKDSTSSFEKGPFGIAFSAFTYPPSESLSLGWAGTMYEKNFGRLKSYFFHNADRGMYEVAANFMACELAMVGISVRRLFKDALYLELRGGPSIIVS